MGIDEGVAKVVGAEMVRQRLGVALVANVSAVPERTLRRILRAQQAVKLCQVCRIAAALGMSCGELVTRAESATRS